MLSPAGKPVALNVSASPSGSLAVSARFTAVTGEPLWLPGLVSTGGLLGSGADGFLAADLLDVRRPGCTGPWRSASRRCARVTAAASVGAEPSCRYGAVAHTSRSVGTSMPVSGAAEAAAAARLDACRCRCRFAAALFGEGGAAVALRAVRRAEHRRGRRRPRRSASHRRCGAGCSRTSIERRDVRRERVEIGAHARLRRRRAAGCACRC